jgi:hypothetical protein
MVKIALAVQDEIADPGLVLTRMNRRCAAGSSWPT